MNTRTDQSVFRNEGNLSEQVALTEAIKAILAAAGKPLTLGQIRSHLLAQRFFPAHGSVRVYLSRMAAYEGSGVKRVWTGLYAPEDWHPKAIEAWLVDCLLDIPLGDYISRKDLRKAYAATYGRLASAELFDIALERLVKSGTVKCLQVGRRKTTHVPHYELAPEARAFLT